MQNKILENIRTVSAEGKTIIELYNEISAAAMREISFTPPAADKKSAYYLSIEFLIGRMFYKNRRTISPSSSSSAACFTTI